MICKDCRYYVGYKEILRDDVWPNQVWNCCIEPTNCRVEDFVRGHSRKEFVFCYDYNDKGQCKNGEPREENEP